MNAKDKKQISEFWDTVCEARAAKLVLIKNSSKDYEFNRGAYWAYNNVVNWIEELWEGKL